MSGALRQLQALVALRWQMARAPGVRLATVLGGVFVLWLVGQAVRAGRSLDIPALATAIEVAPAAYAGFGVLAVLAPLTAGAGSVVPPEQLVAYPVRPATHLLSGLLLAPLNLVWIAQLLGLAALTACLTLDGSLLRGAATTGAYVLAVTVSGQLLAWLLVGLRSRRWGRRVAAAAAAAGVGALVTVSRTGRGAEVLDLSPTHSVVAGVIAGGDGHLQRWATTTGVLLLVAVAALLLAAGVSRWALHRAGDPGRPVDGPVRRRPLPASPLRALVAVDRASVWRVPALRRGAVVLAVLPGLLAAAAALPWSSLVVLPGLVATGAALLFGINAFSLDASGAVWLASLPHDPMLALRAKAVLLAETVLAGVVLAVLVGSSRTVGAPTGAEVAALVCSAVLCTAVVVALGMSASVRRPHRADLRGPQDAVAPPGALAVASARLAVPTAGIGVVLGTAGGTGTWWVPPAVTLPLLVLCGLSLVRTSRLWSDPVRRADVVHRVATG